MKVLFVALIAATLIPQPAQAAWWNPFSWKNTKIEVTTGATTTASTTDAEAKPRGLDFSNVPTSDDLNKRISELEQKLEDAYEKIRVFEKKQEMVGSEPVAKVAVKSEALSDSQVVSKIKSVVVLVETATSSGSGVIVDSQGSVLIDANLIWIENADRTKVMGATKEVSVTLSNGTKKKATLVGIDEAQNSAIVRIVSPGSVSYLKPTYDTGVKVGDAAYIFGIASTKGEANGGSSFVTGTISKKSAASVEMTASKKPLDNGGVFVNAKAELVGIPNKASCKVIEEGTKCLTYTVTTDIIKDSLPKLIAGMKLYKDKQERTAQETLIRGQLDGIYLSTKEGVLISYAVNNVTGSNSFDTFNSKLSDDEGGRITKIYLTKLKNAADNLHKAMDFLKSQSYNLNIFFINESSSFLTLDDYQRKTLKQIEVWNATKVKEYQQKLDQWTAKRNEYDGYITKPNEINHDYLMAEGVAVEKAADYLKAEQKKIIEMFSGENVNIF